MKKCLFLLLTLPLLLLASPIHVRLSTAFEAQPLYLLLLPSDKQNTELEKVIRFDIANNGKSVLVKNVPEMDTLLAKEAFTETISYEKWKARGVTHCLAIKSGKTFSAHLIDVHLGKSYQISDLAPERKEMHRLSDKVMELFFKTPGIAQSQILFTLKQRIDKNREVANVWESDYDGANARKLTNHTALCVTPYKGKERFLFVSYESGQPKIHIGSRKSTSSEPFLRLRGQQMMPVVSPNQKHVAFVSDVSGNPDLFLVDIDKNYQPTSKPRQIYGTRFSTQGTPAFSPDSKQIAFVSNQDGIARIYLIDIPKEGVSADKIKPRLLTKRRTGSTAPAWSPDGTKIAYSSTNDGFRQIWIYDLQSAEEVQLTSGNLDKENPTWAPDSLHLIYNAGSGEDDDLYLIDLNNRRPVRLTQTKGSARFPSW